MYRDKIFGNHDTNTHLYSSIPNRKEPGDGGIDHFGGYRGYTVIGQCKNYLEPGSIGPQYLRDLEGVLSRYHKYTTIGILVAPSKASFSKKMISRAKSSEYIIILTDIANAYSDLVRLSPRPNIFTHSFTILKLELEDEKYDGQYYRIMCLLTRKQFPEVPPITLYFHG
ncbi:11854_t:CDS:2, partial [Dentiscutata erythropus]